MAKKKSSKTEKDFLPRKDLRTRVELNSDIDELLELVGQLRAMTKEMHDDKIDAMVVDGVQKMPRAKDLLREYCGNIWMALYRERMRLGKAPRLPVSKDT